MNTLALVFVLWSSAFGAPHAESARARFAISSCENELLRNALVHEINAARPRAIVDPAGASLHQATLLKRVGLPHLAESDAYLVIAPSGEAFVFGPHESYGPPLLTLEPPSLWERVEVARRPVLLARGGEWRWAPGVVPPRGRDPGLAAFARAHRRALGRMIANGAVSADELFAARLERFRWELDDEAWILRVPRPAGVAFFFFTGRDGAYWPASAVLADFRPHHDYLRVNDRLLYVARAPAGTVDVEVDDVNVARINGSPDLARLARERPEDLRRLLIAPEPVPAAELPHLTVETAYAPGESVPIFVLARPARAGATPRPVAPLDLSLSEADLRIKFHHPTVLTFGDGRRMSVRHDGLGWHFAVVATRREREEFWRDVSSPAGAKLRFEN